MGKGITVKIKRYLRNIWIYPVLWMVTGFLGSIQRINSPLYDQYLMEASKDVEAPAGIMLAIGTFPVVVLVIEGIVIMFYSIIYVGFYKLLQRRLPKIVNYLFLLLSVIFWGYLCALSVNDAIFVSFKYGFYILALQDVIWFIYTGFVVSKYSKLYLQ